MESALRLPRGPHRRLPHHRRALTDAHGAPRSVNHRKFLLQREGYAAAISDPQVIEAIKSGPHQSIALCYIEWSGFAAQKLLIDWSLVDGPGAARKFGDRMRLWAI